MVSVMIVSLGLPSGAGGGRHEGHQLAGAGPGGHVGVGHGGAAIASAWCGRTWGPAPRTSVLSCDPERCRFRSAREAAYAPDGCGIRPNCVNSETWS